MSIGVIYFATGNRYLDEAARSAASVKQFHPDLSITLFTDRPFVSTLFDNVITVPSGQHPLVHQLMCMGQSPYDITLSLDTDTFVCAPLGNLFDLMERFDMASTFVPRRHREQDIELMAAVMRPLPESVVQLSPGFLLYKKSPVVSAMLAEWLRLYERDMARARSAQQSSPVYQGISQQLSMLEALYYSSVRFFTLPNEYNCVFMLPGFLGEPVRVLHGRHPDLPHIAECLNAVAGPRVHTLIGYTMTVTGRNGERRNFQTLGTAAILNEYRQDLRDSVERRGIRGSLPYFALRLNRFRSRFAAHFKSNVLRRDRAPHE